MEDARDFNEFSEKGMSKGRTQKNLNHPILYALLSHYFHEKNQIDLEKAKKAIEDKFKETKRGSLLEGKLSLDNYQ